MTVIIGSKFSLTDFDFYSYVCFMLPAINAVSVNCYPNYSTPDAESASEMLT